MSALKIDTTKSLYKPIEIEIDGKTFRAVPITRVILRQMGEMEKKIRAGEAEAAYDQIELIFGADKKFDKLDLRQVNEIVSFVTSALFRPERISSKDEDAAVKKKIGPGDKK